MSSENSVATSLTKPKRALLAYCALADSLNRPGANLLQALTPFFAPICALQAGKLFDAANFSEAVFAQYGLRIPRLAVLGLAEQLERDSLLISIAGPASKPVFQYANRKPVNNDGVYPVTESEIDQVLLDFATVCRSDPLLSNESDEDLHEEFLERLLHTDSMKLLSRREAQVVPKREENTLSLKRKGVDATEQRTLRLDFHVAQYLLDLQAKHQELFNRVSDIAFANMAAEALACFREPSTESKALDGLTVYFDSPLLLDILGVNADYTEYGAELLQMVKDAGARPAVFDDCIDEAESVVAAQITAQHTGIAQRTSHWGTSAKLHVLTALSDNIALNAQSKGFEIHRDPNLDLLNRARTTVGDIQADMTRRMQAWSNDEARKHDERSVWSMLRSRGSSNVCFKVSDSKSIFIARNTALVRIANDAWKKWLKDCSSHSQSVIDRWAPVAMSDKQLAGYLWLRKGAGNGKMSKARLLAHCSAAIRPRADIKANAYNLVLSLHGKDEAEAISALLEDREGERALMRATKGDPLDVTAERLPYILEQVKLAAGEYAAKIAREEGSANLDAAKRAHQEELTALQDQAGKERADFDERTKSLEDCLQREQLERKVLEAQVLALANARKNDELAKKNHQIERLSTAFGFGLKAYRRIKIELVVLFGSLSLLVTTNATDWAMPYQLVSTFVLTCFGFWFVPEILENFVCWHARQQMMRKAKKLDVQSQVPSDSPNFKDRTWAGLDALQMQLSS